MQAKTASLAVLVALAVLLVLSPLRGHVSRHVRRNPLPADSDSTPAEALLAANTTPVRLVNVTSAGSCGPSGATPKITAFSGPNGNIDFLNCGIKDKGGWSPPLIHVDGIVSVQLSHVAHKSNSAFAGCKKYISIFEKYATQYNVPAIMLASFAMQESSCIPTAVGGGGEQGLMQITSEKCVGAPGNDCKDPDFNIGQAARYFSNTLEIVNGDLLLALGQYNGWHKGMTYAEATAAARNGNCREQNNLDYLHEFLNAWVQGVNPREHNPPIGKYFNLDNCPE